jgi:hypothetical protein
MGVVGSAMAQLEAGQELRETSQSRNFTKELKERKLVDICKPCKNLEEECQKLTGIIQILNFEELKTYSFRWPGKFKKCNYQDISKSWQRQLSLSKQYVTLDDLEKHIQEYNQKPLVKRWFSKIFYKRYKKIESQQIFYHIARLLKLEDETKQLPSKSINEKQLRVFNQTMQESRTYLRKHKKLLFRYKEELHADTQKQPVPAESQKHEETNKNKKRFMPAKGWWKMYKSQRRCEKLIRKFEQKCGDFERETDEILARYEFNRPRLDETSTQSENPTEPAASLVLSYQEIYQELQGIVQQFTQKYTATQQTHSLLPPGVGAGLKEIERLYVESSLYHVERTNVFYSEYRERETDIIVRSPSPEPEVDEIIGHEPLSFGMEYSAIPEEAEEDSFEVRVGLFLNHLKDGFSSLKNLPEEDRLAAGDQFFKESNREFKKLSRIFHPDKRGQQIESSTSETERTKLLKKMNKQQRILRDIISQLREAIDNNPTYFDPQTELLESAKEFKDEFDTLETWEEKWKRIIAELKAGVVANQHELERQKQEREREKAANAKKFARYDKLFDQHSAATGSAESTEIATSPAIPLSASNSHFNKSSQMM